MVAKVLLVEDDRALRAALKLPTAAADRFDFYFIGTLMLIGHAQIFDLMEFARPDAGHGMQTIL